MIFLPTTSTDVEQLMSWFTSEQQLAQWAGPDFRYPYNKQSFIEDSNIKQLASYSLLDDNNELLAFGQFYQRLQCVHLARIVVAPTLRGQGLAKVLLGKLSLQGKQKLRLDSLSLFVLPDNQTAIQLYQSLGFELQAYPEKIQLVPHCLYMVKHR